MTTIKMSSEDWRSYRNSILLKIYDHGWTAKRQPHHFNLDSIRRHGDEKKQFEAALKELETMELIFSSKRPILTTSGLKYAAELKQQKIDSSLGKKTDTG
ncbi:MAG: hypothetical protein Q7T16_04965 [Candidatus Burarchaeum sp.]|nr:hypothetical protein [Candidatus Burarchaeum sp.]MDO8339981.1 hypothetical protein [Candidatus Burarchaeum sp.]